MFKGASFFSMDRMVSIWPPKLNSNFLSFYILTVYVFFYYKSSPYFLMILIKAKVGNDQEIVQPERKSHSKYRDGKN